MIFGGRCLRALATPGKTIEEDGVDLAEVGSILAWQHFYIHRRVHTKR